MLRRALLTLGVPYGGVIPSSLATSASSSCVSIPRILPGKGGARRRAKNSLQRQDFYMTQIVVADTLIMCFPTLPTRFCVFPRCVHFPCLMFSNVPPAYTLPQSNASQDATDASRPLLSRVQLSPSLSMPLYPRHEC